MGGKSPAEALRLLICESRARNSLGQDWEEDAWPLPSRLTVTHTPTLRVTFGHTRKRRRVSTFAPGFGEFAKALCCEYRNMRFEPYVAGCYLELLKALRLLDLRLTADGRQPHELTRADFDAAARQAVANGGGGAAKPVLSKLGWVAETLASRRLVNADLKGWRSPVEVASQRRAKPRRMLSEDEVGALAHLSSRDDLPPADRLRLCAVDLMMCGGFRVGEVCALPVDPIVREPVFQDGEMVVCSDGLPAFRYGLRYWVEKNGPPVMMLKAIPTVMVPVAVRAVERALRLTREAREVATFQRRNPGATTLGQPWDDLAGDTLLTAAQVAEALGMPKTMMVRRRGPLSRMVRSAREGGRALVVLKSDLYAHLAAKSFRPSERSDEPTSRRLEDLLFVVHHRMSVGAVGGTGLRGTARPLSTSVIDSFLSSRGKGRRSVFERQGYHVNGRPIAITTGQPRAFLNTLAMRHGVNPLDLARWMGRFELRINSVYDRRTEVEKAEELRESLIEAGALSESELKVPLPWDSGVDLGETHGAGHVTAVGVCTHDLAELPCAAHADMHPTGGSRLVSQTELLLRSAEAARDRGEWGAQAWVDVHAASLDSMQTVGDA